MAATFNAVLMLLVVAATVASCAFGYRQRPDARRLLLALVAGCTLAVSAGALSLHMCRAGHPFRQVLVCSACLCALWIFVTSLRTRVWGTVAIAAGCAALCVQFDMLVHSGGAHTGNPADIESTAAAHLDEVAHRVRQVQDPAPRAAGWLADQDFVDAALRSLLADFQATEACALWHTPMTGLYGLRRGCIDIWYPGGAPAHGGAGLQWRRR